MGSATVHVGTAALGCPAEQRSAILLTANCVATRPDNRGGLLHTARYPIGNGESRKLR